MKPKTQFVCALILVGFFLIYILYAVHAMKELGKISSSAKGSYEPRFIKAVYAGDFKIDIIKETYGNNSDIKHIHNGVSNRTDNSISVSNEKVIATVTAYSEWDGCKDSRCIMANGKRAKVDDLACPRALKLGSKVEIAGKRYICTDRTNRRLEGRYDLFVGYGKIGHDRAVRFGKQRLEVKIIN